MPNVRMARRLLLFVAVLIMIGMVVMPNAHAANNVHTFFTNNTTVGTCGALCKGLTTTSGTASTATVESSLVEGSSPTLDTNTNAKKTGNWVSGSTYTVTGLSTTSAVDTIIALTSINGLTITESAAPSTTGITWDASKRQSLAPASCAASAWEWIGHTTTTLSSVTTTITLSGTPVGSSTEIIAFNGAEDPAGVFNPFDKASGFTNTGSKCSAASNTAPSATSTTTLNADDMIIGMFVDENSLTETAGTGFTLDLTVATACGTGPGCSLALEHKSDTATTAETCPFGTSDSRWIVLCDAIQAAPTYYKVEPETSASLAGTPSTAANGFSGTGWVFNTAGLQSPAINDIQSGTWQIDLKGAVGSTFGTPVARYFVTAWSCTTNSCTTTTLLWKNWDTATNVASSTTQTAVSYTTASQASFASWSGNFLAIEVWVAWQYSGSTTSTTMTQTTIDTSMDIKTPGWDSTESLSATVAIASALTHVTNIFKSLSGSLASASSLVENNSIFRSLAASIAITVGNMVANVDSGKLICNSSPHSCSTTLTATWTMASGFAERSSLFRSLTGSLGLASSLFKSRTENLSASLGSSTSFAEKSSLFRSLTGSLTSASSFAERSSLFTSLTGSLGLAGFETKGLARSLTGSLTLTSSFAERSSLFRSVTGSLGVAGSETKGLAKSLSGSLSSASSFAERSSLFRSVTGSLSLASSLFSSRTEILSASMGSSSSFAEKSSLFRSLNGSLSPAASETKGTARSLSGSLTLASGFAEKSSLFRSLTGSLALASSFAEKSSLFKSLTGSLGLASSLFKSRTEILSASMGSSSSFAEKSSLFRSLTSSLGLASFETKGLAKSLAGSLSMASSFAERSSLFRSLSGSLTFASGFAEKTSLFRSLSGSLGLVGFETKGLARSLTGSLTLTSSFAEKSSLFRSLTGSLTLASGFAEKSSLFRSLTGSLSLASSVFNGRTEHLSASLGSSSSLAEKRGSSFIQNLQANFTTTTVLSGHSDCFENMIVNCGSASASFAFLVIAFSVLIFGVYATKQYRQSTAHPRGPETENVFVDKEGWERKVSDDEEGWEKKAED